MPEIFGQEEGLVLKAGEPNRDATSMHLISLILIPRVIKVTA